MKKIAKKLRAALVRFLRGGDVVVMDMKTYMEREVAMEERLCEIEKRIEDFEPKEETEDPKVSPAELFGEWLYGAQGGDV